MRSAGPSLTVCGVAVLVRLLAPDANVYAQKGIIGPAKCIDCHDHDYHSNWWKKEDGTTKSGKIVRHFNSLARLDEPNSAKYAKAIGLSDVYDTAGSCVRCHGTVFRNEANAGVSCESCHGGASGYLEPHKEKGAYRQAVAAGMRDIMGQPQAWAPDCMRCHVMDSRPLIDAGHPSGDEFNIAEKFRSVAKHWQGKYGQNTGYAPDQIARLAAPARAKIIAQRGGGSPPPQTTSTAATSVLTTVPPALPQAAEKRTTSPSTAGPTSSAPPATTTGPSPARPGRPTSVRSGGATSTIAVSVPPTIPVTTTTVAPPVVDSNGRGMLQPAPAQPLPLTPTGAVAAVQGRLIALLSDLLNKGSRTPTRVTPPDPTIEYSGMDADLLQLQEEAIALALQALSVPPTTPATTGSGSAKP